MSDTYGTNEEPTEENTAPEVEPRQLTEEEDPPYDLVAVNNARAVKGKHPLTEEQAEKALEMRPEPDTSQPYVETQGQYLVALPALYVVPSAPETLDDGRMGVTAATPPRE